MFPSLHINLVVLMNGASRENVLPSGPNYRHISAGKQIQHIAYSTKYIYYLNEKLNLPLRDSFYSKGK